MPWVGIDDFFEKSGTTVDSKCCERCNSKNLKFVKRERYVNSSDQNPVLYKCLDCGRITTFWD